MTVLEEKAMELPKAIGKPDHRVAFEKSPKRMRVLVEDTTIADTIGPGLMFETGHRPVYYFPRQDVRMDLLERTEHRTHCPYKGDASYWTIKVGDRRIENAVWSYEQPLAEIVAIKDYLASHPDEIGEIVRDYLIRHPDALGQIFAEGIRQRGRKGAVSSSGAPVTAGLCAIAAYIVGSDAAIRLVRSLNA